MIKKMQNVLEIVLSKDLFRKVYMVLCILYLVPSVLQVPTIPLWLCFFWGIAIIAYDLFTKRLMFKMKNWLFLLIISISLGITVLLNFKTDFIYSAYKMIYVLTFFYVIYPIDLKDNPQKVKKELISFNNIFILVTMLASFISLIQFIFVIRYHVPTGVEGLMARQGFMESRLFGIFTSPNVGSIFGFASVIMMVLNNLLIRKSIFSFTKIYVLNLIVQYFYFVLSSSRGTQLTITVFCSVFLLMLLLPDFRRIIQKYSKKSIKWVIVSFLMVLVLCNVFLTPLKSALGYIPATVYSLSNTGDKIENEDDEKIVDGKVVIEHSKEGSETSSGRFTIWESGIAAWKQSPIFGFGDINFYRNGETNKINEAKLTEQNIHELKRSRGYMHNGYIQILVSAGIVGFVLIGLFMIVNIKQMLSWLLNKKVVNDSGKMIVMIMFSLFLALLAEDLVEAHLLFNVKDVIGLIFWYYLGVTQYIMSKEVDGELL